MEQVNTQEYMTFNIMEKARMAMEIRENSYLSIREISYKLHESERTVYRLLRLNDLIPEFQEMIESGALGIIKGYHLASLDHVQQEGIYKSFRKQILMKNRMFVEKVVKQYKEEKLLS